MANKKKIPTKGDVGGGLFQAFASLDSQELELPEGPPFAESGESPAPVPASKMGRVVLRKEKAHRGGKAVIVIDDFDAAHSEAFINDLARQLRQHCGCGGAVKDRAIELQGEQVARIRAFLESKGFKVAGIR